MAYSPPQTLDFDFSAATSGTLSFEFLPLGITQTISGTGTDVSLFGVTQVANVAQGATTSGTDFSVYGQPFVDIPGPQQTTVPVGINAPPFGTAVLGNTVRAEFGPPLPASTYGSALHFQFTLPLASQQVYPLGLSSQAFGGSEVKFSPFVYPVGTDMSQYGTARVDNKSDLLQTVYAAGADQAEYGTTTSVGRALRFKFGLPDYVAPTPLIEFDFVAQGGTQYIFFLGSDYSASGSPTVDFYVRYASPDGIPAGTTGTPAVSGQSTVSATGFASQAFGGTTVYAYVDTYGDIPPGEFGTPGVGRRVAPTGFDSSRYGSAGGVDFYVRTLQDVGGIFAFLPSTGTVVESTIRYVDHGTYGKDMSSLGTPTTWFRVREVAPPSIAYQFTWDQFGDGTLVWFGTRYVTGIGWESSRFGAPGVARNEVVVQPPSVTPPGTGQPDVQLRRRYLGAWTIGDTSGYGTPWLSYSPRYVYQYFGTDDYLFLGGVGVPWNVENRNRTVGTFGWVSSRFGSGTTVYNNARVLEAKGTDTALYGDAFVADAIRYVTTIGHQSSIFHSWNAVYNYSQRIEPSGIPRPYMGVPYVWSNTQFVDFVNAPNYFGTWGTQFVAHAIRTVSLDLQPGALLSNGIPPPLYQVTRTHYVGLFRQFAAPTGLPPGPVGSHVFEQKFNIIKPWGPQTDTFGTPEVRNRTPEIGAYGWQEFEMWRNHRVSYYVRYVQLVDRGIGPPHEFLPRPVVEYRTRTVQVPGINSLRIPLLHDVRFDVPQIPAAQNVFVQAVPNQSLYDAAGFGSTFVRRMPMPSGWDSAVFGTTWVRVQGCSPLWDNPSSEFGIPSLNPPFELTAEGFSQEAHGKPGLSPHTVYCTYDAPQQYIANHGPTYWEDIDSNGNVLGRDQSPAQDPQWGRAFVSLKYNRVVGHYHGSGGQSPDFTIGESFGVAKIENTIRSVLPDGIPPGRLGFPELPTNIEIYAGALYSAAFGDTTVELGPEPPSTRTVYPTSAGGTTFGTTFIELLNRPIYPVGTRMDVYGNNNPMVHFPRKIQNAGALDATSWGDHRVEFKIRVIYPAGHHSFTMAYSLLYFNDRLRVYRKNNPVYPAGINSAQFGTAQAKLAVQVITVYQIAAPCCIGPVSVEEV